MKNLRYIYESVKGLKRKKNKDDILIVENDKISLYILFDGVSSSLNAKKGINTIKNFIKRNLEKYIKDDKVHLKDIIFDANNYLLTKNINDAFTTCSAFAYNLKDNSGKLLNIGDSRIYFISKQYKKQLTIDDNEVMNNNIITNFLGKKLNYNLINESFLNSRYLNNGNILICSDGFYKKFESNIVLFHKALNFKRLGMTKNKLLREVKNTNNDDSSYIYILTNNYV